MTLEQILQLCKSQIIPRYHDVTSVFHQKCCPHASIMLVCYSIFSKCSWRLQSIAWQPYFCISSSKSLIQKKLVTSHMGTVFFFFNETTIEQTVIKHQKQLITPPFRTVSACFLVIAFKLFNSYIIHETLPNPKSSLKKKCLKSLKITFINTLHDVDRKHHSILHLMHLR